MTVWLGILLGVYGVAMLGLGLYAGSRVHNEEDYLVAGRRLPLWLAWGTLLATWFGAATILGSSAEARNEGLRGTILDPFASGLALVVVGLLFAKPVWEMKLLTVGDLFARKYGRKTELVSSIVQAIGYLPWIAAQYLALAAVARHFFGIEQVAAIMIAAAFVMILTMLGGMWSVTLTDTLQIVVVLVSLVVLGFHFCTAIGNGSVTAGVEETWRDTPSSLRTLLPEAGLVAFLAWSMTWTNGIMGNIPGQDLMQRVSSCRSGTVASRACLMAGGAYLLFGMLPVGLGLASRLHWPNELPQNSQGQVLLALAEAFLAPSSICLLVVTLVAIVVSTCTSALLSPAAILSHNLLHRLRWFHDRKLLTHRMSVGFVTLLSLPFAFATERILELLGESLAVALVSLLVPFVAGVFFLPRGELPGLLAIGCGGFFWLAHKVAAAILVSETAEPGIAIATLAAMPPELTGLLASLSGYICGQKLSRTPIDSSNENTSADPSRVDGR